jgi:hypothetical protein
MKIKCKFCNVIGNEKDKMFIVSFYVCDECQSIMCYKCMYTSIQTGKDYCTYCKNNLQREGKLV